MFSCLFDKHFCAVYNNGMSKRLYNAIYGYAYYTKG